MELKDWLIIAATCSGPILAVQAQKFVERFRSRRSTKLWVFNTLMASRAARVSADHVKALNMIDLVFYSSKRFAFSSGRKKDQAVLDAWKEYLDHLNSWQAQDQNVWTAKGEDLFLSLLAAMATNLGFSFDRVQLKRGAYLPRGQGEYEWDSLVTRKAWLEVLNGQRPLKMEITNIPGAPPPSPGPSQARPLPPSPGSSQGPSLPPPPNGHVPAT